ncbi:helix-turn-helix transcriptional regulator [Priestia filamentosa]|uniref:helix-turn-helix transcriptional regulator n=1 Tax=Priestia filamentosa TaxID=1402861 RepID=UPI0002ED4376|nr:AraC family transcriptional regulator [Priestia filamentosa]
MEKERFLEDRVHGDTMFPLKMYKVDYLDGDVIINYHWHREMEFIFLKEGSISFQIGTSLIELKEGEAIFIPSGQLHAAYPFKQCPFLLYAIVFDSTLLSSFTYDVIQSKYIELLKKTDSALPFHIQMNTDWEKSMLQSLSIIIREYQHQEYGFELAIKAHLFLSISNLIKSNTVNTRNTMNQLIDTTKVNRLKLVLQYIDNHYSEKLNIRALSSVVQMSEGHFSRFFRSLVHMTPIEYINTVRINKATKLLRESDEKIINIAMEVGFDSPSYFIKTFKRQKKCTPTRFRKLI